MTKKGKRFVVECVWSGYKASQERICHRTITTYPEAIQKVNAVEFNDHTHMTVKVRLCTFREKVKEIHGYDKLLFAIECQRLTGWIHVNQVEDRYM